MDSVEQVYYCSINIGFILIGFNTVSARSVKVWEPLTCTLNSLEQASLLMPGRGQSGHENTNFSIYISTTFLPEKTYLRARDAAKQYHPLRTAFCTHPDVYKTLHTFHIHVKSIHETRVII